MKSIRSWSSLLGAVFLLAGGASRAQIVTTLAGNGQPSSGDGAGAFANFSAPQAVAVGPSGSIYVADTGSLKIRKITPAGIVTTLAGSGSPGYADGVARDAQFFGPLSVAADPREDVWVADKDPDIDGQWLKKITPDGVVHNLQMYPGFDPRCIAIDVSGTMFVIDFDELWKIPPQGNPVVLARGLRATAIAVDDDGNVYLALPSENVVRKVGRDGTTTVLAGSGNAGLTDGVGAAAAFRGPSGVAVDSAGNVYVADAGNHAIRRITPSGRVTTLAGSGHRGSQDGDAAQASFDTPAGIAVDSSGDLYVADTGNNKIRKIKFANFFLDLAAESDGATRLLRFAGNAGTSFDRVDASPSISHGDLFGPYPGWTPRAIAAGTDGLDRILWIHEDGSAALWLSSPDGISVGFRLGAVSGATAVDVAAAALTHVLWKYRDRRIAVWTIDAAGEISTGPIYGPFPDWTPVAIADGEDGLTRILWSGDDGSTALWFLGDQGIAASSRIPRLPAWAATDIAVGGDGMTRILWSDQDGRMAVWIVDQEGNVTTQGPAYATPPWMTTGRIASGPDGSARVLFTDAQGAAILFSLSSLGVFESAFDLMSPNTGGIMTGTWTGTFSSDNNEICGFDGIPARATFVQQGSFVWGILDAPTAPCFALESRAFIGTIDGGTLIGRDGGFGYVSGTVSGTTLEIGLGVIQSGYPSEGQLHLHR